MYTPIVRCRQSEVLAIRELPPDAKAHCVPLLDLPAPSKNDDKVSPADYTERNIGRLKKALDSLERVFVDSSEIDPTLRLSGGKHPLVEASKAVALAGAVPVPVTGLHRDASHMKAASKVRTELANGSLCIRLDPTDINTATLTYKRVLALLSENAVDTSETILLLDLQSVFREKSDPLVTMVSRFMARAMKSEWAGVVIAGYGIPDELGEAVAVREQGYIPRTEQIIYRKVAEAHTINKLWFGDYTTLSPTHVELDWRLMSRVMSPKATYTLEDSWFVVRGGPFSRHADGYGQYYDLAAEIVALEEFSGAEFSYGDNYIKERADRLPPPGNPSSWIKACVNHHITLTAVSHNT